MENLPLIRPSSVILASGGARGITARCVIRLAETFQCGFILVGRSRYDRPEPDWANGIEDPAELKKAIIAEMQARGEKPTPQIVGKTFSALLSSREIENTLASIQNAGGRATYVSVDIADPAALREKIASAEQELGHVTGVIHGAGSLADKRIEKKTAIDFEMVYSPKVNGLRSILACIPPDRLDFMVLFSSVVALYGNAGQADYAIANTVLDRAARLIQARSPQCRVFTINWGPWEGGMVTPELKRFFTEKGVHLIPVEEGAQTLVELLTAPADRDVQVVVGGNPLAPPSALGGGRERVSMRRTLTLQENPFLMDHAIGGKPVLPATCAAAWIIHACETRYPGYRLDWMEDFRVLKGLVFDETLAGEHTLEIEETKQADEQIELKVRIFSKGLDGKTFYHYSARLALASSLQLRKRPVESQPLQAVGSQSIPGSDYYADGTLFHGPRFQGVLESDPPTDDGLTMRVRLPDLPLADQGQFPARTVNPFLNDAVVQCLLIWSQRFYEAPCLPSHLERYEQPLAMKFDQTFSVHLKVREHTPTAVIGDILIQDSDGQVAARITGLQGTVSPLLRRLIPAKAA